MQYIKKTVICSLEGVRCTGLIHLTEKTTTETDVTFVIRGQHIEDHAGCVTGSKLQTLATFSLPFDWAACKTTLTLWLQATSTITNCQ